MGLVEVGQEVDRRIEHDEVPEGDPCEQQDGGEEREAGDLPLGVLLEGRREKAPELPEDDRKREQQPRPQADPERRQERLGDVDRNRVVLVPVHRRQRPVEPVQQGAVEGVRDASRDGDGDQAEDDSRTKLAEMLDKRRLLPVREAARQQAHGPRSSRVRACWCSRAL